MARRSCSSADYIRKDDADESPTFCLTSIWLIATISRISVRENWRAVLFVILNIAETPEIRPEHCRLDTNSFEEIVQGREGASSAACSLRASSRQICCPFPFHKPVSVASAFALVLQHSSTALWADQVDDGRDDVRVGLAGQCVKCFHNRSPALTESAHGVPTDKNANNTRLHKSVQRNRPQERTRDFTPLVRNSVSLVVCYRRSPALVRRPLFEH